MSLDDRLTERLERAHGHARALLDGDLRAASGCLISWGLSPSLIETVMHMLHRIGRASVERPSRWAPGLLRGDFAPTDLPEVAAREAYAQRSLGRPPEPIDDLVLLLDELEFLGTEYSRLYRASFPDTYTLHADDDLSANLWSHLIHGRFFEFVMVDDTMEMVFEVFHRCYVKAIRSAFRTVMQDVHLKSETIQDRLASLDEPTLLPVILGEPWMRREIAVRVVETLPPGALASLSRHLPSDQLGVATQTVTRIGEWARSVQHLFDDLVRPSDRDTRVQGLMERCGAEELLGAHVICRVARLLEGRATISPKRCSDIARRHWRGARGRLRALVATLSEEELLEVLHTSDALHARTEMAMRWFAGSWARNEISTGFAFNPEVALTSPCDPPDFVHFAPWTEDEHAYLSTWCLLMLLKRRLGDVDDWCGARSLPRHPELLPISNRKGGAWNELLKMLAPLLPVDPTRKKKLAYPRAQIELVAELSDILDHWRPTLVALADLPSIDAHAAHTLLRDAGWHDAIPLPKRSWSAIRDYVRNLLPLL